MNNQEPFIRFHESEAVAATEICKEPILEFRQPAFFLRKKKGHSDPIEVVKVFCCKDNAVMWANANLPDEKVEHERWSAVSSTGHFSFGARGFQCSEFDNVVYKIYEDRVTVELEGEEYTIEPVGTGWLEAGITAARAVAKYRELMSYDCNHKDKRNALSLFRVVFEENFHMASKNYRSLSQIKKQNV